MEKALRGVMTTGAGATAVTGYLQAKGHGEVVGIIASERVPCILLGHTIDLVPCCTPPRRWHRRSAFKHSSIMTGLLYSLAPRQLPRCSSFW